MEELVAFMFWYLLVLLVLRLFVISTAEYPRTVKFSLGNDIVTLFIGSAQVVWFGLFYFGVLQ